MRLLLYIKDIQPGWCLQECPMTQVVDSAYASVDIWFFFVYGIGAYIVGPSYIRTASVVRWKIKTFKV